MARAEPKVDDGARWRYAPLCEKCGGPMSRGTFTAACLKCYPFWSQPCCVCGQKRLECYC